MVTSTFVFKASSRKSLMPTAAAFVLARVDRGRERLDRRVVQSGDLVPAKLVEAQKRQRRVTISRSRAHLRRDRLHLRRVGAVAGRVARQDRQARGLRIRR